MIDKLEKLFESYPGVKLVYLFGSQAGGHTGPLSDYDFAVYFDTEMSEPEMFDLKFNIQDELGRKLKTNKVDLIILNSLFPHMAE
jgi:predicted nucleotidyltransferase